MDVFLLALIDAGSSDPYPYIQKEASHRSVSVTLSHTCKQLLSKRRQNMRNHTCCSASPFRLHEELILVIKAETQISSKQILLVRAL